MEAENHAAQSPRFRSSRAIATAVPHPEITFLASGYGALTSNTTGGNNTAAGYYALQANTLGNGNTATGSVALFKNMTGNDNTAFGDAALYSNVGGSNNTANGFEALSGDDTSGSSGSNNTASGYQALYSYTTGSDNSATGFNALYKNTTSTDNTASGYEALYANRSGGGNTASGFDALYHNTDGHYNIAQGYKAGYNLTTGSYNIDIGHLGVAAESGIIRIGTSGQQTQTFIAGITNNSSVTGPYVVIDSTTGQLGVTTTPPPAGVKTAYVPTLQKEVRRQAAEIRDLKQEVEELKLFNQATQIALQKLQSRDELMAQR